jgi:thiamine monophosphate synthase
MFAYKKKYFLIIQNIKDIDLNKIKKNNKIIIILRNQKLGETINCLIKFRKKCKLKGIEFFVANNSKLAVLLKSDGIYISAFHKGFKQLNLKKLNKKIMGSAHNFKEINEKRKQGCSYIILSKLFQVDYAPSENFFGIVKFNLIGNQKNLIPLGGIKLVNLNKAKLIKSEGIAIMSEIKKKPAISSRLF